MGINRAFFFWFPAPRIYEIRNYVVLRIHANPLFRHAQFPRRLAYALGWLKDSIMVGVSPRRYGQG